MKNLHQVLDGLASRFPAPAGLAPDITWNTPGGGFFVVISVPFAADDSLLEYSARQYGVLWTPMSHFYSDGAGTQQLRLAFSQLTPDQIGTGLDRLAALVADARGAR